MSVWFQHELRLPPRRRGFHLITRDLVDAASSIAQIEIGLMHCFIEHTSASLTINENADPDVRTDFETAINHIVPETLPYVHTLEGPDDMPAHIKASLMGPSVSVPIQRGRLRLGTWQGIYLCEHRDRASSRSIVITVQGKPAS